MNGTRITPSVRNIFLAVGAAALAVLMLASVRTGLEKSFFLKLLYDDASEFAATGHITSNFMPIGYSGFVGACMKIGGAGMIPACQAGLYAGILFSGLAFLWLSGIRGGWLWAGMGALALHPMLVLNVWRIHDGNMTILLLLGFCASGFWHARRKTWWSNLCFGGIMGLMLAARINTALLMLPAILLLRFNKKMLIFLAGAFLAFLAVNLAVKQQPVFFPSHGLYNLFSGSNEYSAEYLLKDFSGENSHKPAFQKRGIAITSFQDLINFPPEKYKAFSLEYIQKNPVEYAKLTGIKIFTLLRPGYHVPENFQWISVEGVKRISKIVLALPFFIWIFTVWKTRSGFFEKENVFIFLVVGLYILPFFVANADPRYRFPIDIMVLLDSIRRTTMVQWKPRTKDKEQRTKDMGQRTENKGQRTTNDE